MIKVVWAFVVKPQAIEPFERAYGPAGDSCADWMDSEAEIGIFEEKR